MYPLKLIAIFLAIDQFGSEIFIFLLPIYNHIKGISLFVTMTTYSHQK